MKYSESIGWWIPDSEEHIVEYMKIMGDNEYQPRHQQQALKHCTQFRTALDIGAHVGLWSRGMTKSFKRVIAFEPYEPFIEILWKNAPDVHVVQHCALGAAEGTASLFFDPTNTGATYIVRGEKGDTRVEMLDSFGLLEVDFIKIDVEGYELEVLRGANDTLKNNNPVIILEQKNRNLAEGEAQRGALKYLMDHHGYRVIGNVIDDWIMKKP